MPAVQKFAKIYASDVNERLGLASETCFVVKL
jgi:hypothetical protein